MRITRSVCTFQLLALGVCWAAPMEGQVVSSPALGIETTARAFQPGELVVYRIDAPPDTTGVTVAAFERTFPAFRETATGWLALVGIDLDVPAGPAVTTVRADHAGGQLELPYELVVASKRFPTRRLKVNPALVEPPRAALDRIRLEAERTNAIYGSPDEHPLWLGPFMRPVPDPANSRFGSRSIFNGTRSSPHTGADFLSGSGTPVLAPNAGRVRLADALYFSGNTVILDHGLGLFSVFAHLSAFDVHEGDVVSTGEILGKVGATGRVTGPHLHWSVRLAGARIDPLSLLALLGQKPILAGAPATVRRGR
ncbi:MAG: M23 family metallopeptidase [Vicinamibacterales bacterium]